jgi:hypothetical protein
VQLKAVLRDRGSYGYRRATVLVNRAFGLGYNPKRIQRVMRLTGLALAVRRRSRKGRPDRGEVRMPGSNQRWCSDKLSIVCRDGALVEVMFVLDCHNREEKPQEGQAPGASPITLPRRHFEDRRPNLPKSGENSLQTVALATRLCRPRK